MKTEMAEQTKGRSLPVPVLTADATGVTPTATSPLHVSPDEAIRRDDNLQTTETGEPAQTVGDQIAERAYFLYLARRGAEGDALSDWLEAERQIRQELSVHG